MLTNTKNYDELINYGYYYICGGQNSTAPSAYAGSLIVIPSISIASSSADIYNLIQIYIAAETSAVFTRYARYSNSAYTWNDWKMVNVLEDAISSTNLKPLSSVLIYNILTDISTAINNLNTTNNMLDRNNLISNKRIAVSNGVAASATNQDSSDFIPVISGTIIKTNAVLDSSTYGMAFYGINKVFISGVTGRQYYSTIIVPENAYYMRITYQKTDLENDIYLTANMPSQSNSNTFIVDKTKWLAIGDSITKGVYSTSSSSTAVGDGYVKLLAESLDYDITVMASRGMGYTVSGQDPNDSSLPRIMIDELLNRTEALTDDFNLITMAFGINDYNTKSTVLSNIISTLDYAIQRLVTKWPTARLIVITPFNCTAHGTANSKYALNYSYGDTGDQSTVFTLKELADAIKTKCDEYGIECIYATDAFLFNTLNINQFLLDTVHPSMQAHKLIAKTMAHYLLY